MRDSYWWVNQGRTWQEERTGGYLWAPTHAPNGQTKNFWTRILDVQEGDEIVSYSGGRIIAISTALSDGYHAPRPLELPGDRWQQDGFRMDVSYVDLRRPLPRDAIPKIWREGGKEEPFRRDGFLKQGYLFPISATFFAEILDLIR